MFYVSDRIQKRLIIHSFGRKDVALELYESSKLPQWKGIINGSVLLSDHTPIAAWGKHATQEEISWLLQALSQSPHLSFFSGNKASEIGDG